MEDPSSDRTEAVLTLSKKGNQGDRVTICHFPLGNPDNPKAITVGKKAAEAHVANHEGDGIVGEDYDESCEPLTGSDPPDDDRPVDSNLPDLRFDGIDVRPLIADSETGGFTSDVVITIGNAGGRSAGSFDVAIGEGTVRVLGLSAGTSRELSTSVSTPNDGPATLEFLLEIDVGDEVAEVDETNNDVLIRIEYSDASSPPMVTITPVGEDSDDDGDSSQDPDLPDLLLDNVDVSPLSADSDTEGFTSDVVVTIGNAGRSPAGAFGVRIGEGTVRLPGLSAGASREVSTSVFTPNGGPTTLEFLLEIDVEEEVAETDETNNDVLIRIEYPGNSGPPVVSTASVQ